MILWYIVNCAKARQAFTYSCTRGQQTKCENYLFCRMLHIAAAFFRIDELVLTTATISGTNNSSSLLET